MPTPNSTAKGLSGLRILIAEDDDVNRQLLEIILVSAGAEVTQVCNGATAVAVFDPQQFDLAILDLRMPGLDGFETLRRIHQIAPDFPVAALTACALCEDRAECQAAGFEVFLTKPILPGDLINALRPLAAKRAIYSKV